MPKPIITNTDLITEYIDFGSPMNQVMLITAMDQYAKHVIENEADIRKQLSTSFIHPDTWMQSAYEWVEAKAKQQTHNK